MLNMFKILENVFDLVPSPTFQPKVKSSGTVISDIFMTQDGTEIEVKISHKIWTTERSTFSSTFWSNKVTKMTFSYLFSSKYKTTTF